MMRWLNSRILWGCLLILGGILFLLQNLWEIKVGEAFWAILFLLAGGFFLAVYLQKRDESRGLPSPGVSHWWALIPSMTCLGIGVAIGLGVVSSDLSSLLSGPIILGGIGVGFLLVFLFHQENWWALIPAGTLLTLTVVALLDESSSKIDSDGVLFLGLGLTFALVALLRVPQGNLRWAWIPAGILFLIGLIVLGASVDVINYVWPAVLILAGGLLVLRTVLHRG